ncbi:MAG: glycosyltransferase family 4 protein [Candidatus Omnitrophica bacterium]|nr:glycosyltransferase family 4 protein [Candidatus Omnitrophota bacterium]
MKILLTHLSDPDCGMGGAEQVVLDIALGLKNTFHEEVACAVNQSRLAEEFKKAGIAVTEIFWSKAKILKTLTNLKETIRNFQPDLIHSHHRYPTFLLDLLFKKKQTVLHTEHLFRRNKRWLFRYGHFATAVSHSVRDNLIEYFKIPSDRVMTISNAVSLRPPDLQILQQLQQRFPKLPGQMTVLFLGRLEEQKGHRDLIEAVERMKPEYRKRLKVLIAGEGKLKPFLQQKVTRRNLNPQFEFLGFLPQTPELLALSDFLILPSLYEGMPLVVIEAFAAGKTVIATDIPGTREVVENGRNGLLVPLKNPARLAEALEHWLDHPEEITRFARQAFEDWKERFLFQDMIEKYHRLYQKLISSNL